MTNFIKQWLSAPQEVKDLFTLWERGYKRKEGRWVKMNAGDEPIG